MSDSVGSYLIILKENKEIIVPYNKFIDKLIQFKTGKSQVQQLKGSLLSLYDVYEEKFPYRESLHKKSRNGFPQFIFKILVKMENSFKNNEFKETIDTLFKSGYNKTIITQQGLAKLMNSYFESRKVDYVTTIHQPHMSLLLSEVDFKNKQPELHWLFYYNYMKIINKIKMEKETQYSSVRFEDFITGTMVSIDKLEPSVMQKIIDSYDPIPKEEQVQESLKIIENFIKPIQLTEIGLKELTGKMMFNLDMPLPVKDGEQKSNQPVGQETTVSLLSVEKGVLTLSRNTMVIIILVVISIITIIILFNFYPWPPIKPNQTNAPPTNPTATLTITHLIVNTQTPTPVILTPLQKKRLENLVMSLASQLSFVNMDLGSLYTLIDEAKEFYISNKNNKQITASNDLILSIESKKKLMNPSARKPVWNDDMYKGINEIPIEVHSEDVQRFFKEYLPEYYSKVDNFINFLSEFASTQPVYWLEKTEQLLNYYKTYFLQYVQLLYWDVWKVVIDIKDEKILNSLNELRPFMINIDISKPDDFKDAQMFFDRAKNQMKYYNSEINSIIGNGKMIIEH